MNGEGVVVRVDRSQNGHYLCENGEGTSVL